MGKNLQNKKGLLLREVIVADAVAAERDCSVAREPPSSSNFMQPVEIRRNFSACGLITYRASTSGGSPVNSV